MCSACSNASTAGPKRRFRNAVKISCSIFRTSIFQTSVLLRICHPERSEGPAVSLQPDLTTPAGTLYTPPIPPPPSGPPPARTSPQKTAKRQGRTFEYSIGNRCHQPVSHHKTQQDPTALFAAVPVDDAIARLSTPRSASGNSRRKRPPQRQPNRSRPAVIPEHRPSSRTLTTRILRSMRGMMRSISVASPSDASPDEIPPEGSGAGFPRSVEMLSVIHLRCC